ncbi:MAG: GNAT family N-acetyltransferase [Paraclostridium sp.]
MKNLNLTVRNIRVDTNIGGDLKAPKDELQNIRKLLHMLYDHECSCAGIPNTRTLKSMMSDFDYIESASHTYFIEADGEVVGSFVLFNNCICNLVIRPKFRRKGIATWLINEHLAGQTLRLQVRESNEIAMEFYESIGFVVEEDWYNYYQMIREA